MKDFQTLFTDYIIQKNFLYIFLGVFPSFLLHDNMMMKQKEKRSGKGCNYYNYIVFCRWQGGVERIQGEFFKNW